MLQLDRVQTILDSTQDLLEGLHGLAVDDTDAMGAATSQNQRRKRTEVAGQIRQLLMIADRLAMAEALVRNEYWKARGEDDFLDLIGDDHA